MAGIGFKLQKYFYKDDILENLKGTIYSVVISSGPWLISVLTIAFISIFAQRNIQISDLFILKSMICYTFAASLIIFGATEMPITRYIADQLYKNDHSTFKSLFFILVIASIIVGTSICVVFYSFFPTLSLVIKATATMFFCSVLIIWLSMIFLTAAKNYHQVVFSFLFGALISIVLCFGVGKEYGLTGYVVGYCLGQYITAICLAICVFKEFKGLDYLSFEFLKYFKKCRVLIFAGLFYYLGIWVDKFIFWVGPEGEKVLDLFYTNRYYDTAMFFAYITIVPSLAIFLVQVETNFYKFYSYYFHSIERQNNLNILKENIDDIIQSIRRTLINLIKIQLGITLTLWYFADEVMEFLYLPSMVVPIFKYGIIGALLQALFLIINIILLYFLNEKRVMFHYFLFFILNLTLTQLSTYMDFRYHGLGYLVSSFIVLMLSIRALNNHVKELNFFTFMSQPIER